MQEGDLLQAELVLGEGAGEVAGHVVGGDGAEEVGVVALLGQLRRGGRRRNGHDLGVVVDRQGGLGRAGTDGAHNGHGAFGKDLGGGVGAEFGLALVVFGDDFDLFAENAALGVVFVGDDASRVKARHSVGNEVAGVCTGNADFDRIGSMHRGGHGHDGHTRKSCFHPCACHKETSPSFIGIVGVIGQARLSEAVHAEKDESPQRGQQHEEVRQLGVPADEQRAKRCRASVFSDEPLLDIGFSAMTGQGLSNVRRRKMIKENRKI